MSVTNFSVGQRLRLDGSRARQWWEVRAVTDHFTAVVRQAPFEEKGVLEYTVLDWRNGIRGPCNEIGQGYGDGSYSPEECAEMLNEFEYDYRTDPEVIAIREAGGSSWPSKPSLEVSRRNNVPLKVIEVDDVDTWQAVGVMLGNPL